MTFRPLNPSEITTLVKKADLASSKVAPKVTVWPNSKDRLAILNAYDAGDRTLKLGEQVFQLRRRTVQNEPGLFIFPNIGFAPCGEFRIAALKDAEREELGLND